MSLEAAQVVARVVESYALAGVIFALMFLPRASLRVDPHLQGAPLAVRLLILPGVAAFWPLMAWRWASNTPAPIERNPHRRAAGRSGPR